MNYDKVSATEPTPYIKALIERFDKALCFYATVSNNISFRINNLSGAIPQDQQTEVKQQPPSCALEELEKLIIALEYNNNYLEIQESRLKQII